MFNIVCVRVCVFVCVCACVCVCSCCFYEKGRLLHPCTLRTPGGRSWNQKIYLRSQGSQTHFLSLREESPIDLMLLASV